MFIVSKVFEESIQKVFVAFVDNNDMVTDGEDAEENMNVIITEYNDLHSATGGHIEEEKSKFYAYHWKIRSGRKVIKNEKKTVVINGKNLQQIDCKKSKKNSWIYNGTSIDMGSSIHSNGK